jgi:hypothetical protein
MGNLATTNLLLGIMAAVSVLEGLLIIGIGVAAWKAYRAVMDLVTGLEQRHVVPAMTRVTAILEDVKAVSTTVRAETDRVDHAIHNTMDRVDDTVHRVQTSVRDKTSRVIGFVRGVRTAIAHVARTREGSREGDQPPARLHVAPRK